jgi:hypothetical protein
MKNTSTSLPNSFSSTLKKDATMKPKWSKKRT